MIKKSIPKSDSVFDFGHFFCPFLKSENSFPKKLTEKIIVTEMV